MLFDNFEPFTIPETGDVSRATLKAKFPEMYEANSRGLLLGSPTNLWVKKRRGKVSGDSLVSVATITVPPNPISIKAKRSVTIGGKQVWLQYSEQMPNVGTHSKTFPSGSNKIELKEGFPIRPDQEDLLFFLYFGCSKFISIEGEKTNTKTMFYFRQPHIAAANEISGWKRKNQIEKLVFEELNIEQIERAIKALHLQIDSKSTEDQKRIGVRNILKDATPELYTAFMDVVNSKPSDKEVNISEEVSALIADEKIKFEDGVWKSKSKTKIGEWNTTPFYKSKTDKFEEAVLELVEQLKLNTVLFDKIKS